MVSLTLTPMVCGRLVAREPTGWLGRVDASVERFFRRVTARYMRGADWSLRHRWTMIGVTILTIVLTFFLYSAVPKNFVAEQDTGLLRGT